MPDAAKQLLVKFKADLRDLKSSFRDVEEIVSKFQRTQTTQAQKNRQATDVAMRRALSDQKVLQEGAKSAVAQETVKIAQQKALQAEIATVIAQRKAESVALDQQIKQLRLKTAEEAAAQRARKGHAEESQGLVAKLMRSLATVGGGGFLGSLFAGGVAGGGFALVGDQVIQSITSFVERVREAILSIGPLQQLEEQFNKLSQRQGVKPDDMLNGMRTATQGLVGDMQLFRVANNFMQSGIKVSAEQIQELTKYTVGLARAQGKDATQAMERLTRASMTGRTQMLAMAVGISAQELRVKNLGTAISGVDRNTAQFLKTLEVMKSRYEAIGEPQLTFTDRMQQMSVAQSRFFEQFALSLTKTTGFKDFVDGLADTVTKMASLEGVGTSAGQQIGKVFSVVTQIFRDLKSVAADAATNIKETGRALGTGEVKTAADEYNNIVTRLTTMNGLMFTFYKLWSIALNNIKSTVLELEKGAESLVLLAKVAALTAAGNPYAAAGLATSGADDISNKYSAKQDQIDKDTVDSQKKVWDSIHSKNGGFRPPPANPEDKSAEQESNRRAAQLKLANKKAAAKEELEVVKERIQKEKEAEDTQLKEGKISLAQYVADVKLLDKELSVAKQKELDIDFKAQKQKLAEDLKQHKIYGSEYKVQLDTINKQQKTAREKNDAELDAQVHALNNKLVADRHAAIQLIVTDEKKQQDDSLKFREKQVEQDYKDNLISVAAYLKDKQEFILEETQIELNALQERFNNSDKGLKAQAELYLGFHLAQQKAEEKTTALIKSENDIRFANAQKSYQDVQKLLQGQLSLSSGFGGTSLGVNNEAVLKELSASNEDYLKQLNAILDASTKYSEQWFKIKDAILSAQLAQQKYNQQLFEAHSIVGRMLPLFEALGNTISGFSQSLGEAFKLGTTVLKELYDFQAKTGKSIFSSIGDLVSGKKSSAKVTLSGQDLANAKAKELANSFDTTKQKLTDTTTQALEPFRQKILQVTTAFQDLLDKANGKSTTTNDSGGIGGDNGGDTPDSGNIFGGEDFGGGAGPISGLGNAAKSSTQKLKDFANTVSAGISVIGDTIKSFTQPVGAGAGAIAGGTAGAGVGGDIGGMFSKISSAAGPIGMAAGAAAGIILGGIMGNKRKKAEDQLKKLQQSFTDVTTKLQEGAVGLNDAITQLQGIRQSTVNSMNSSGKKEKSLFQSAIQQMDQQIQTLQVQQDKLIKDLTKQVQILSASPDLQTHLNALDQLLDKYKQFKDAARNATELALANQFLSLSLQQYAQTQALDLSNAEQTAIQDAIQLNDLLQQRQDLITNEANAEYAVMTRGVLSQMQTTAQSKFAEITKLRTDEATQQAQIDNQIALAQYKVNAESTIFSLATTRIGLESQLLALQEAQVDRDMVRIKALQQVLAVLNNNSGSLTSLDSLLQALGLETPSSGSSSTGSGSDSASELMMSAYALRGRQGSMQFRGY